MHTHTNIVESGGGKSFSFSTLLVNTFTGKVSTHSLIHFSKIFVTSNNLFNRLLSASVYRIHSQAFSARVAMQGNLEASFLPHCHA